MQVPVEIAFCNCLPAEEIRAEVDKCVQRLEKFSDRLTNCHVVIQAPETRHRHGDAYRVTLRIVMPRHKDIVVDRSPADEGENGYPWLPSATPSPPPCGKSRTRPAKRGVTSRSTCRSITDALPVHRRHDYGFIAASDGQEIYFHRNAVPYGAFDRLKVGDEVRFVASDGENGLQASTVHPSGKHHPS